MGLGDFLFKEKEEKYLKQKSIKLIGFMDFLGNLFKKIGLICPLFGLVF